MCGKDLARLYDAHERRGSPPHVRERRILKNLVFALIGITPACAGKTHRSRRSVGAGQDHPRMCGKDPA